MSKQINYPHNEPSARVRQCSAIMRRQYGESRCRRMTADASGFCPTHRAHGPVKTRGGSASDSHRSASDAARERIVACGKPASVDLVRGGTRAHAFVHLYLVRDLEMPLTRSGCSRVPRPCPHTRCKWHLYLDALPSGSVKINFPNIEPWEMPADRSCALDVADRGGETLDEVAATLNMTRERVRQIEEQALHKLSKRKETPR